MSHVSQGLFQIWFQEGSEEKVVDQHPLCFPDMKKWVKYGPKSAHQPHLEAARYARCLTSRSTPKALLLQKLVQPISLTFVHNSGYDFSGGQKHSQTSSPGVFLATDFPPRSRSCLNPFCSCRKVSLVAFEHLVQTGQLFELIHVVQVKKKTHQSYVEKIYLCISYTFKIW